ncbi:MAG: sigma-54 dependent transcriptional regulator [Phycisphaerae bacterium]
MKSAGEMKPRAASKRAGAADVLLVDNDPLVVDSLSAFLRREGYAVQAVGDVDAALRAAQRRVFPLVITDINLPKTNGFELLQWLRRHSPETVVIVVTAYGTIESAVEAIKLGAYDYLTKPISEDDFRLAIQRALQQQALLCENQALKQQLEMRFGLEHIVGDDYRMHRVFELVEAVADTPTTVLITGESGTGKSLIARAIHQKSDRRDKPFVEVSCGALPETLLESELFGHMKGAFTGAVSDKPGRFSAADGGTIFLDEISAATPALQVKLLRVLQERCFEPVGGNDTRCVDVRVLLASNQNLAEDVAAGRFRQDLYYRINVVVIDMPPLRERMGDIPALAERFLDRYRTRLRRQITGFTPEAIKLLHRYAWPGNVRELENTVERAVVLAKGRQITVDELPETILSQPVSATLYTPDRPTSLRAALEGPEKHILEAALRANDWNRQSTAEALQINRTTLYKKMKRHGLEIDPVKRRR